MVSWPSLSQVVQQLLVARGLLPDNTDSGQLAVSLRVQAATLPDLRWVNCLFQFFRSGSVCLAFFVSVRIFSSVSVPVHMFLCAYLSSSVAYLTVFVCVSVHLSVCLSLSLSPFVPCASGARSLPSLNLSAHLLVCFSRRVTFASVSAYLAVWPFCLFCDRVCLSSLVLIFHHVYFCLCHFYFNVWLSISLSLSVFVSQFQPSLIYSRLCYPFWSVKKPSVKTKTHIFSLIMMSWRLMSSDVSWHIRDKLWPMPKHGSINLYGHGNQKAG